MSVPKCWIPFFAIFTIISLNAQNCVETNLKSTICLKADHCETNCERECEPLDPTQLYNIKVLNEHSATSNVSDLEGSKGFICLPKGKQLNDELPKYKTAKGVVLYTDPKCLGEYCRFDCEDAQINVDTEKLIHRFNITGVHFFHCRAWPPWFWAAITGLGVFVFCGLLALIIWLLCCCCCPAFSCRKRGQRTGGHQTSSEMNTPATGGPPPTLNPAAYNVQIPTTPRFPQIRDYESGAANRKEQPMSLRNPASDYDDYRSSKQQTESITRSTRRNNDSSPDHSTKSLLK